MRFLISSYMENRSNDDLTVRLKTEYLEWKQARVPEHYENV